MQLSVVMPVYNERTTLRKVMARVLSVPVDLELICVDDGSQDGSREILAELQTSTPGSESSSLIFRASFDKLKALAARTIVFELLDIRTSR